MGGPWRGGGGTEPTHHMSMGCMHLMMTPGDMFSTADTLTLVRTSLQAKSWDVTGIRHYSFGKMTA